MVFWVFLGGFFGWVFLCQPCLIAAELLAGLVPVGGLLDLERVDVRGDRLHLGCQRKRESWINIRRQGVSDVCSNAKMESSRTMLCIRDVYPVSRIQCQNRVVDPDPHGFELLRAVEKSKEFSCFEVLDVFF